MTDTTLSRFKPMPPLCQGDHRGPLERSRAPHIAETVAYRMQGTLPDFLRAYPYMVLQYGGELNVSWRLALRIADNPRTPALILLEIGRMRASLCDVEQSSSRPFPNIARGLQGRNRKE